MRFLGQCGNDAQLWMCLVVKIQCSKEQYGIGTWNAKSVNQGKLNMYTEEALQIPEERREAKGKGYRERHTQLNAEFQRIASRER